MQKSLLAKTLCICIILAAAPFGDFRARAETPIDLSRYDEACEVRVEGWNGHLRIAWPMTDGEMGVVTLDLSGQRPLIEQLATRKDGRQALPILGSVDPVWFLTIGERRAADEKPPEQKWEVFFDNPVQRPHETVTSNLDFKRARVSGSGKDRKSVV